MRIDRYNRADFNFSSFATDIKKLFPLDTGKSYFSSSLVAVKPGQTSMAHMHHDTEIFLIVKGQGAVSSNEKCEDITEGDVIYFDPYTIHAISNHSQQKDLLYLTIWWQDSQQYLNQEFKKNTASKLITYVYSAAPTPNGDLHLGHLAGPYLAADIYKRFHGKLCKEKVYHFCGVDENQSYPQFLAKKKGIALDDLLDKFASLIEESLNMIHIELDGFIRPRLSQKCGLIVQDLFNKLVQQNLITELAGEVWYCEDCQEYLHEAYLKGKCPHCQEFASSGGCESCNLYFEEIQILEPKCAYCQSNPQKKTIRRWYFALNHYKEELLRLYNHPHINALAKTYFTKVFKQDFYNIPISHLGNWGRRIETFDGKKIAIYSYFEILARYLVAKPVITVQDSQIIQFLGIDNSFWRLVFFPAILLATNEKDKLNYSIVNEFYQLEHKKFSTSREHAIWIRDILKSYQPDVVRLYLCYTRPEFGKTNFSSEEFESFISNELEAKWQNFIEILDANLDNFGRIPPEPGLWSSYQYHYFQWLQRLKDYIIGYYQAELFSPKAIAEQLCRLLAEARQFFASDQSPSDEPTDLPYYKTKVALGLLSLKLLAILVYPIMSEFSLSIFTQLKISEDGRDLKFALSWLQSNQAVDNLTFNFRNNNVRST
jgi:methionyl-tRNA synthetase